MNKQAYAWGIGIALLAGGVGVGSLLSPAAVRAQEAGVKGSVEAVDGKALRKALDAHKGKVVVMNLWATWCGPCVEEFPDLVKLHNTYKEKGLVVLGVSMDEPEDRGKVVTFAGEQKAGFPIFLRKNGDIDPFINPIDKGWKGVIPTTYVFDREGKRVGKPMVGLKKYEDFVKAVEPLLKQP